MPLSQITFGPLHNFLSGSNFSFLPCPIGHRSIEVSRAVTTAHRQCMLVEFFALPESGCGIQRPDFLCTPTALRLLREHSIRRVRAASKSSSGWFRDLVRYATKFVRLRTAERSRCTTVLWTEAFQDLDIEFRLMILITDLDGILRALRRRRNP